MMKKISWIRHPQYDIPLPGNHKFTSSKFSDLYNELQSLHVYKHAKIIEPSMASVEDVEIAHDREYILQVKHGTLGKRELRKIGFPWSETLMKRSFLALNGTKLTCMEALQNGVANHLAGGTHHSHRTFGSGYCVFNDMAYAALHLIRDKVVNRVLIFDTDVHQGDGTAEILKDNDNIFTCSLHCKNNFPFRKSQKSDLDVELEDNLFDLQYLEILHRTLQTCIDSFRPDLVIYDAGVDVHKNDRLGNLNLSYRGILNRDKTVLSFFKDLSIPIATVIGGGYSNDKYELARRHAIIFRATAEVFML